MAFSEGIVDALDPVRLRLLVEVQRQGSISGAADVCRMGQPSATKHLQTLEAAVGEKLVERQGRASRLTEAGEIVAAHALRVLDTLEGMSEDLRALREAERGTLTLAASTTPGTYVLPSILQCFAERHPNVDVDVVIGSSTWVAGQVAGREVSLGLAFVSKLVVEDELARGDLVPFRVEGGEPMRRSVFLLRPDGREVTPSENVFLQTLCSCCGATIAGCTVTAA